MNRLITLHDVLNRTIVYSGWARIEPIANGKMIEFEDETYQYCWKIYEKGMTLTSKSEMDVVLTFKDQTKTKGHIDSEFGRMDVH
ncbi:MAG: hypothetical protein J6D18_03325, partial [Erysipelotrichaceae bacterium]|nr:hypothetical protein [Erysipelotrichaceae bacterium]